MMVVVATASFVVGLILGLLTGGCLFVWSLNNEVKEYSCIRWDGRVYIDSLRREHL